MRRAFTLVEAIATIAVLLLVAGVAVPNLVRVREGQRRRSVIAALERLPELARVRARERGEAVAVRIETDAAVLVAGAGGDSEAEITRVPLLGLVTLEPVVAAEPVADETEWEWRVQPDGTAPTRDARLVDGATEWTARFEPDGRLRWLDADEVAATEDSWPAGERVDRGQ